MCDGVHYAGVSSPEPPPRRPVGMRPRLALGAMAAMVVALAGIDVPDPSRPRLQPQPPPRGS